MSRWFRFYSEALDDPKVQRLDGETFKAWINLLCLANRNGGFLPSIGDIAFALRMDANGALTVVERLLNATLLDKLTGGVDGYRYAPHGWNERQYKSDTSTERVKRFRKRSKPVSGTGPDTDTEQSSVDKSTGAAAPVDPVKLMFDGGISLLGKAGHSDKQARSMIGRWRAKVGDDEVRLAIAECQLANISDPLPYLEKRFANPKQRQPAEPKPLHVVIAERMKLDAMEPKQRSIA